MWYLKIESLERRGNERYIVGDNRTDVIFDATRISKQNSYL